MKRKTFLLLALSILMVYPAISAYFVLQKFSMAGIEIAMVETSIVSYQLSIWIVWGILVIYSIYHKWTTGKNLFFLVTYFFLVVTCGVFGYFIQEMVTKFSLSSTFQDNYSLGVFTALQHFAIAAVLTGFLQVAVWWFTRRWHRR